MEELTQEEMKEHFSNFVIPAADWTSDDNYLNIKMTASQQSATADGTPIVLDATASWLKYPTFRFSDTFAIVYTGSFDDSYITFSTFNEAGTCSKCDKKFSYNGTESYGPTTSDSNPHYIERTDLIVLDFAQAHAIGTKIDLKDLTCIHGVAGTATNYAEMETLSARLKFRILVNATGEARALYVHTKLGGTVSVKGQVSGTSVTPVISGGLTIVNKKYPSGPVTLRCN